MTRTTRKTGKTKKANNGKDDTMSRTTRKTKKVATTEMTVEEARFEYAVRWMRHLLRAVALQQEFERSGGGSP